MGGRAGAGILIQRQEGQLLVLLSWIAVRMGASSFLVLRDGVLSSPALSRWPGGWINCGGSTCVTLLPTENSDPNVNKALPLVPPALRGQAVTFRQDLSRLLGSKTEL